jgi:putative FmdB family regulatory protein
MNPLSNPMPIYEYKCDCGWSGDLRVSVENRNSAKCPKCGATLKKQISIPTIRIAIPLTFYQEMPNGKPPMEIGKIADSSRSWHRNYDIPPDYPNLQEV